MNKDLYLDLYDLIVFWQNRASRPIATTDESETYLNCADDLRDVLYKYEELWETISKLDKKMSSDQ